MEKKERAWLIGCFTAIIIIIFANPYQGILATIALSSGTIMFIICSWKFVFYVSKKGRKP